VYGDDV